MVDLSQVSSDDLRAELARRKESAKAKGKPLKYRTKAEWADAKLQELRRRLGEVATGYQPGARGLMRKNERADHLNEEIEKFTRLRDLYQRKGL